MSVASSPIVVALVGLGNIGFRHLQGLNAIADRTRLVGVDLSPENLARAKAEWKGEDALFTNGPTPPGLRADVLLLATSSQGRLKLLREWGERLSPRHVILEKVAFTRAADFDEAARLVDAWDASAYVNCPRRLWPSFHALRARLAAETGPIEVTLSDPNLGLACNGVHIVDAFQFLAGRDDVRLDTCEIDELFKSKRSGYFEAYGALRVSTPASDVLSLTVRKAADKDHCLVVQRGRMRLSLDQAKGLATDQDGVEHAFGAAPFQSALTGMVVGKIVDGHGSDLPDLSASARAHDVLMQPLRRAFAAAGVADDVELPIT